jgi:hypothetical protein
MGHMKHAAADQQLKSQVLVQSPPGLIRCICATLNIYCITHLSQLTLIDVWDGSRQNLCCLTVSVVHTQWVHQLSLGDTS